jgi:8-oxo-dGTP pyrophosphatase MutT (NUDIX family)
MDSSSPFTVTASRIAYENPWLRVREDRIIRPGGKPGLYGVIERRDFAVVVPLHPDRRLTLVQQYRYPMRERLWEFPQGVSEPDDPDLLACAARELREETGLAAADLRDCGRVYLAAGICTQAYSVVLATGLCLGGHSRDATEEDLVIGDFALAEVEAMLRDGVIRDATSLAAFGLLRLQGRL